MTTDATIRNATVMLDFLQRNKPFIGPVSALSITCHVAPKIQIDLHSDDKAKAGGLLGCYYLLGGRIKAYATENGEALVSIATPYDDEIGGAFTTFNGAAAEYLNGMAEVTVHSLRRIQIGDVPAVEAVPA
jgi:hypothetical protein